MANPNPQFDHLHMNPGLPERVLRQQRRVIGRERARIERRDSMTTADYWRGEESLPADPWQRARADRIIFGPQVAA